MALNALGKRFTQFTSGTARSAIIFELFHQLLSGILGSAIGLVMVCLAVRNGDPKKCAHGLPPGRGKMRTSIAGDHRRYTKHVPLSIHVLCHNLCRETLNLMWGGYHPTTLSV